MWAPKTLNTKSDSQGPACFVFHRVSYLKDIPLKTHFTKLGSYTMEKNKEEKKKRQPIFFFFFVVLESFTDFSLENLVLWLTDWINLWSTFTTSSPFLLWDTEGREPTEGRGAGSMKGITLPFHRMALERCQTLTRLCRKPIPCPPRRFCPSHSLWHLTCVFI